jgi:hypothetical protein
MLLLPHRLLGQQGTVQFSSHTIHRTLFIFHTVFVPISSTMRTYTILILLPLRSVTVLLYDNHLHNCYISKNHSYTVICIKPTSLLWYALNPQRDVAGSMGPEECTGELQLDRIRDRPWAIWYVLCTTYMYFVRTMYCVYYVCTMYCVLCILCTAYSIYCSWTWSAIWYVLHICTVRTMYCVRTVYVLNASPCMPYRYPLLLLL